MTHPEGAIGLGYYTTSETDISYLWFATTVGANMVDCTGGTTSNSGGADITYNLSKNPIIVPMPNDDNFSFDIGFVESEGITINVTNLSSATTGSFAMKLRQLLKYQKYWDSSGGSYVAVYSTKKNKPLPFIWSDNTFYVQPRGITVKQESGAGSIVSITVQLEIVRQET